MPPLLLHGDRVTLRPLGEPDLPRLLGILLEPGVSEWWPDYTLSRLRADTLESAGVTSLVIELDGETIGLVMLTEETDPHYESAGIDIAIDAMHLDRGLGTDALRMLAGHLFDVRGHHRLTIDPAVANHRAIAAYGKVGFSSVGIMREYELGPDHTWHDNLLMDMLPNDLR